MRIVGWAALAGFLVAPCMARAADFETTADLKCMAVALAYIGSGEKEAQGVGTLSMLYYLGRIDGRTPDLDLENSIMDQIGAMKPADLQAEAQRCGAFMVARGQKLQDIGRRILERAQKEKANPVIPN